MNRPRRYARALGAIVALTGSAIACRRGEPPTWDAGAAGASSAPLFAAANADAAAGGDALSFGRVSVPARDPSGLDAGADDAGAGRTAALALAPAPSASAAGEPQTHDRPEASGAAFEARAGQLFAAIVLDDADRAMPFFFPLAAYEQVKDIGTPARDWKLRLAAAYARDIHDLHLKLGKSGARARFVRLDVPEARARWVEPREEYNKIGYWRVFASKLRYEIDGREHAIDVKSLISWRGEWFVVHLSGMK